MAMVQVLHAHWRPVGGPSPTRIGAIVFWAEIAPRSGEKDGSSRKNHPFVADVDILRNLLGGEQGRAETFTLLLPSSTRGPLPSPRLGAQEGRRTKSTALRPWNITGLRMDPVEAVVLMTEWLDEEHTPSDVRLGASVRYWRRAAGLVLEALARQRLIPGLKRFDDALYARWLPLLDGHRVAELGEAMPPVCRASATPSAEPAEEGAPAPEELLRDFLEEMCDALAREWTSVPEPLREISVLDTSQPGSEPGLRWARALFGPP